MCGKIYRRLSIFADLCRMLMPLKIKSLLIQAEQPKAVGHASRKHSHMHLWLKNMAHWPRL